MSRKNKLPAATAGPAWLRTAGLALGVVLYFMAVCLSGAATVKRTAAFMMLLTLCCVFLFYTKIRDRIKPPLISLGLVVLMGGLSNLYAVSGKFALYETVKLVISFCLALLLLTFTGQEEPGRQAAVVLSGASAIAGLVSIDMLSTRLVSTPVLGILEQFTTDYTDLAAVEEGVRMTSIFLNPNVFAGCVGLGVLLSLGLAESAKKPAERACCLTLLFVNALSFVLAFSMGACMAIAAAFLTHLALESRERRGRLLLLMVETLAVTLLAAFPASLTGMSAWDGGMRPVPLLCTILGAAALCLLDRGGQKLAGKLRLHRRAVIGLTAGVLGLLAVFAVAAVCLTRGITLQPGEGLRRAAYPKPGEYTLTAEAEGEAAVTVESQNQAETMMHTSTTLYSGPLSQAAFSVPEDSLVVYFNFSAGETVRLDAVRFEGTGGSGSIPLDYTLLPGFIANRLQGLLANQNAIQRFVFFEDGLKIFLRSPLIGSGLGAFENGLKGVQSFYYVTRYAHNHYIQSMADTGVIGLMLFVGLLAVCFAAALRGRKAGGPLVPALGAAVAFMALHAMVEVVFSAYSYLPLAFGVVAVICLSCPDAIPVPAWAGRSAVRGGVLLGFSVLLAVYGILLNCNMLAQGKAHQAQSLEELQEAAELDPFEWADHMLSYVLWVQNGEGDETARQQADAYAERLAQIDSNSLPLYLAEYYLKTGQTEKGFEMTEKYVDYVSSDTSAWQSAFDLLEECETDSEVYRVGVERVADMLDVWNRENMGEIVLKEGTQAFIARFRA